MEHKNELALVDCGISLRQLRLRMELVGVELSDLTKIFISHEHSDHIIGLQKVSDVTGIAPHMTLGCADRLGFRKNDFIRVRSCVPVSLGSDLEVTPFAIPHDAAEPVHYRFTAGNSKFAIATDIGEPNDYIIEQLTQCNVIGIECNYDPLMLEESSYPNHVKNRIRSHLGHLSNEQAGSLLQKIGNGRLRVVLAMHLSENNNSPGLVRTTIGSYLSHSLNAPTVHLCSQHKPTDWVEIPQLS